MKQVPMAINLYMGVGTTFTPYVKEVRDAWLSSLWPSGIFPLQAISRIYE